MIEIQYTNTENRNKIRKSVYDFIRRNFQNKKKVSLVHFDQNETEGNDVFCAPLFSMLHKNDFGSYVAEVFDKIIESKKSTKGLRIIYEPKFLRHFTAHFERLK